MLPYPLITKLSLRPSSPSSLSPAFLSFSPIVMSPVSHHHLIIAPLFFPRPTALLLFYYTPSFVFVLLASIHTSLFVQPSHISRSLPPLHAGVFPLPQNITENMSDIFTCCDDVVCALQFITHERHVWFLWLLKRHSLMKQLICLNTICPPTDEYTCFQLYLLNTNDQYGYVMGFSSVIMHCINFCIRIIPLILTVGVAGVVGVLCVARNVVLT